VPAPADAAAAERARSGDGEGLRVALVYPDVNLDSSLGRLVVLQARVLAERGVDVHCYCDPRTRRTDIPGVAFHDVVPVRLGRPRGRLGFPLRRGSFALAATRALRRARGDYDIVDVRQTSGWEHDVVTIDGVVAAMQHRWPQEVGQRAPTSRLRARAAPLVRPQVGVERLIQRLQLRPGRFRRVIAVTELVRDDLARHHRVPPELVDVVPHPVDLSRFTAVSNRGRRASLGIGEADVVLLFVGDAFERKGLYEATAALGRLGRSDVHLVVVGRGDPEPVRRAAAEAGVAGRVHLVGVVDEPAAWFAAADVFVLPTRSEPFGLVLLEAMAAGVPAVTTVVAGAAPLVREAGAGVVLDAPAPELLAAELAALAGDPARRHVLGERARAASERLGVDANVRAVLAAYGKAIDRRRRGAVPVPGVYARSTSSAVRR
jgi:UDP-glucose:(heptosyl)LPS alpha-1,3-glucosyltransferase